MEKIIKIFTKGIVIVLLLSVFSMFPLFNSGFFPIHDNTQVERVYQMQKALSDGQFPVRWVQDLGYGYRYPIFNFYAPLPYYFGAIFFNISHNIIIAAKLMFALGILGSAISMYFFSREMFGRNVGIVSAIAYLYFPYHAVNIYVRGAVAEFFAYAVLPLCFLGIYKLWKLSQKKSKNLVVSQKWVLFTIVSISGLILSHNLSAFMFFYISILYVSILLAFSINKKQFFIQVLITGFFSFLLTAFYTIPMSLESSYTNVSSQIGGGADFQDHYVCLSQLWSSQWGFAGSAPGCVDGMSFKLGKLHVLLGIAALIVGLLYIAKNRKDKDFLMFFMISIIMIIFSIFMADKMSQQIWSILPFMEYIQFPWRFLNITGVWLSMIVGTLYLLVERKTSKNIYKTVLLFLILSSIIYVNAKLFAPKEYVHNSENFYTDQARLRYDVSKISDEYLSPYFDKPKDAGDIPISPVDFVMGNGEIRDVKETSTKIFSNLNVESDSRIRINVAPFPGWDVYRLSLDGKRWQYSLKEDGMYLYLPKGQHEIELMIQKSTIQLSSELISLSGLIILLIGIIAFNDKKNGQKTS